MDPEQYPQSQTSDKVSLNIRARCALHRISFGHYHPIEFDYEIHDIHETRAGGAAVS